MKRMIYRDSIKFMGREVQDPVLRSIAWLVMTLAWLVLMALVVILSPLFILLHLVLRASSRKGFFHRLPDGWSVEIGIDGFQKE